MTVLRPEISALTRVRSALSTLGPSEARVAAVVLAHPEDVVEWSTVELAQAAGTSTATVVRACQSLGFRGFQHLRLELARSAPLVGLGARDADSSRTFDDAIDALRLAQDSVRPDLVESAAAALRGARRIVLVGSGFSGPPLQDLAMRISTLGRAVEAPIDALAQQFAVNSLERGDLCLALSYSGANVQTLRGCTAAADRGATVVLVTSYSRSPIGRLADIVIATGAASAAHDVDPYLARLGHTVVLHALHTALARQCGAENVASMRHVVADALSED